MATIDLQREQYPNHGIGITWTPLLNTDDGGRWDTQQFPDISIQVGGTFGTGGTLIIEGSNQITPTDWLQLTDPQGNPLTFNAAKIEQIQENVRWLRPRVTGGDGSTALTVSLYAGRRR